MMLGMSYFSEKLEHLFKQKGYSAYRLAKATGLHEQHVYKIARGERRPTDEILEKIASISELEVSVNVLKGWRLLDEYSPEEILESIKSIQPERYERLLSEIEKAKEQKRQLDP